MSGDEPINDFDLAAVDQPPPEPCPKCGHDVLYGFGLAGGSYGPYEFCDNDACDYFDKSPLEPTEE